MQKADRQKSIIEYAREHAVIRVSDVIVLTGASRITLYRDFTELMEHGYLREVSHGRYTYRVSADDYFRTPFFDRPKQSYDFGFLESYTPNTTSLFRAGQRAILHRVTQGIPLDTDFWTNNRRLLETILIDLSYASSHLEGNTYDYLDTEVLIKYHRIAQGKHEEEAHMILNHKKAIEYLVSYRRELQYDRRLFLEIHTLLSDGLMKPEDVGTIRNRPVEIGGSAYIPLETKFQLEGEVDTFCEKLSMIHDPFEQSIFILAFIPYLQAFADVNKRTARMACNLPFLRNNLPLLSLLGVEPREYITAILAIYELHDFRPLADIFT